MTYFKVFQQQKRYNQKIRSDDKRTVEQWTETYLLGLVSEIDDILDVIRWKRHRKVYDAEPDLTNLGYDLADLTKYVLSLWELWGFKPSDVWSFVEQKSNILDELYRQEFEPIPTDRLIVITDIDGTLGDWRKTFMEWAFHTQGIRPIEDEMKLLQIDSDLAMRYVDYYKLKEDFESSGQYRNILVYPDAREFLHWLKDQFNAYIIAHTARPWQQYYRIWGDTWEWIAMNGFPIDQLRIGSDSRILLASKLGGDNVLMLEDDPGLMLRAAHSGIRVIARQHPYNIGVTDDKIVSVENLLDAKEHICHDFRTHYQKKFSSSTGDRNTRTDSC
jgi:5'(3')-deoxyribonucleotidase